MKKIKVFCIKKLVECIKINSIKCVIPILVTVLILFFTSCDSQKDNTWSSNTNTVSNNDTESKASPSSTQNAQIDNEYTTLETYDEIKNFSDGLAWIRYGSEYRNYGKQYWGCTNKKGEMIFQFKCSCDRMYDEYPPENYANGYSYYRSEDSSNIFVIDKTGNVCSSYPCGNSEENGEIAHGYGYTVCQNHYSDFSDAYYEYTIYNPDGSVLHSFKTEDDTPVEVFYRGCGVFSFVIDNSTFMYFTDTEKWDKYNYDDYYNDEFKNNMLFVNNSTVIDSSGNIINIDLTNFEDYDKINEIYGNSIIMYSSDTKELIAYNIETKKLSYFENGELLEKATWEFGDYPENYCFNNDGFVFPVKGADGKQYIVPMDYDMNELSDPILADSFEVYSDGSFSVTNDGITHMYKMNGTFIYSLEQKGFSKFITGVYSDGLFATNDNEHFAAFDKEGNCLFDSIKISDSITKKLE